MFRSVSEAMFVRVKGRLQAVAQPKATEDV